VEHSLDTLRLATSLWHFWNMRANYIEGYGWLQDAIERIDALIAALNMTGDAVQAGIMTDLQSLKATALFGQGILIWFRSANTEGLELFEESAALAQRVGDVLTLTYAQVWIAYFVSRTGNLQAALAIMDECQTYFHSVGDDWGVAWALADKGYAYRVHGDNTNARLYSQASADIRYRLGDRWGWSISLGMVGLVSAKEGNYTAARAELQPRLALGREYNFKQHIVVSLRPLGRIALVEGDIEQAMAMFKEGLSLSRQDGMVVYSADFLSGLARVSVTKGDAPRAVHLFSVSRAPTASADAAMSAQKPEVKDEPDEQTIVDKLRAEMGEAAFRAAWAEGQAMTLEQAVEEAMNL
jgi:tetratricopeptide (TPR) repeat protein